MTPASPLPAELTEGLDIRAIRPVSGGDIAKAYRLDTGDGPLFAKTHPHPKPDMFERESAGLTMLHREAPAYLSVPKVLRASPRGLLLEWIEEGAPTRDTEDDLGRGLAQLHRTTHPTFGAIDGALQGYLGSQPVDLTPTTDWAEFFVVRRLRPLIARAVDLGRLDPAAQHVLDRLEPHAADLCGPPEPPALLHGDLWAGNRLVDRTGRNWLIDPACLWGHREVDLAMMALFGGFGTGCFAAYDEAFALADGWRERISWYQLPPLLVHAILFGGGYGRSAMAALTRYL